jgi:hypothetical protein
MKFLSHQDGRSTLCPSCHECDEMCKHIARCPEAGRIGVFLETSNDVKKWMDSHGMHPNIARLLLQYLHGRGRTSCLEYANDLNLPDIFREYAASQDMIGWDNFIMGMISHKLLDIQSAYFHTAGESYWATRWIAGLITHLLQVTNTQWIYRCVLVHNRNMGVLIMAHKADLLKEIEH